MKKVRTIADLPEGPFHVAVVSDKHGTEKVTAGKIETENGERKMFDIVNDKVYGPDSEVPFFQKFQNKHQ